MTIRETLATLSAAEQFFDVLDVPFDQGVVNVSRLHILKRFRELMKVLPDDADRVACARALGEAYGEFAAGRGVKSFKVFKDAMPGFVPLSALKSPC